jgi:hypothetical protein
LPYIANQDGGWIPFKASALRYRNGQIVFADYTFGLWDSYGLGNYELPAVSFSEGSRAPCNRSKTLNARQSASDCHQTVTDLRFDLQAVFVGWVEKFCKSLI